MVPDAPRRRRAWRIGTRLVALLLLAGGVASCGPEPVVSAPVQPTPFLASAASTQLPFREATYVLWLRGPDSLSCPALQKSGQGGVVITTIDMISEGTTWRGRPGTPAGGAFDLTLTAGPVMGGPGGGPGVSGTLSGFAMSTLEESSFTLITATVDRRVSFGAPSGPPASVTGGVSQDGVIASGQLSGDFVFSSSTGVSAVCRSATISWMVSLASQ